LCTTSQAFLAIYKFSKTMKALPPGTPYVQKWEKLSLELTLNCCSRLQNNKITVSPFGYVQLLLGLIIIGMISLQGKLLTI
jgi:hypothetical protein